MGTSSNIKNLILLSAISSTVIPVSYEIKSNAEPTEIVSYDFSKKERIIYETLSDTYSIFDNNELEKTDIIVSFSQELANNLTEMDSEFVEIINNNIWDLL